MARVLLGSLAKPAGAAPASIQQLIKPNQNWPQASTVPDSEYDKSCSEK